VRRVLCGAAIAVGSLLLVAAIAIAAMVRRDIPLAPEVGVWSAAVEVRRDRRDADPLSRRGPGQPLVLLQGFGSSLFTWDRWVRQLAAVASACVTAW
jgi:hypothetical protein